MNDFKAIGKPTPILDGHSKVTGAIRFTPDLNMPGVLHARFVSSPHAHANILAVHSAAALAVPGVVAVLTAQDLPNNKPFSRSRLLLARGRTLFVGQPVALVLATSEAAAADGLEHIHVDYEPLPAAVTLDEALVQGAPLVWPTGVPSGAGDAGAHGADVGSQVHEADRSNIASQDSFERGDVNTGFAEADVIVEHTYHTPMVHQSPVEPQALIAQPDLLTGGVTLWCSTQGPSEARQVVANVLGVPESDVRIIPSAVGGGFGSKNGLYESLVAAAAHAVRRPVRLVLTRMEEIAAGNPAPPLRMWAKLGAKRDGTLTALQVEAYSDTGCYPSGLAAFAGYISGSFYRIPHLQINATEVLTFKQSTGPYRAPTGPTAVFVIDTLIDELAGRLNLDPLDMRLQNAIEKGDPLPNGKLWPAVGMKQVLETLRQHPAWKNRAAARAAGRGVGIAIGGWPGGLEPSAAVCSLERDGKVHVHIGSVDVSGSATSISMMAAEAFGVALDDVRITISDTQTSPYGGTSAGSKVTLVTGTAVVLAAQEARRQALAIAAEEFEAAVEDLEIVDGKVHVRGLPSKSLKLGEIAAKGMAWDSRHAPVFAHGRSAQTTQSPQFNAQLVEVEVDRETGEVRVCKLLSIQDVGRAINPLAIEGQLHGGAAQGVGWALYEQIVYDDGGQLLTGSWMDYAMPATINTPEMEAVIVEVPSETGAFGLRGVGEAPVVPTAAAVANAIADATGVRLTELPMTAPHVLAALQAQGT